MTPSVSRASGEAETESLAGPHAIHEALRGGRRSLRRILVARQQEGGIIATILRLARERGVPVEIRARGELDRLVRGAGHQGIVAEAEIFRYADAGAIVSRAATSPEGAFLVVLDGVQDPQNLGAILRSAEAAGAHGVILPRDRAAGVSPAVVRASAGATEHLPVAQVTNLAMFLDSAKAEGLWVAGADPEGESLLFRADFSRPLALVIGAEAHGLRPLVRRRCDFRVRIPLAGQVSSLNASCAAAVCLFEVVRQRRGTGPG